MRLKQTVIDLDKIKDFHSHLLEHIIKANTKITNENKREIDLLLDSFYAECSITINEYAESSITINEYILSCLNDLNRYPIFLTNFSPENRALTFILTNTQSFNEFKWKHIPIEI